MCNAVVLNAGTALDNCNERPFFPGYIYCRLLSLEVVSLCPSRQGLLGHSQELVVGGGDVYHLACVACVLHNSSEFYSRRWPFMASKSLFTNCSTNTFQRHVLPIVGDLRDTEHLLVMTEEQLLRLPHIWARFATRIHSCHKYWGIWETYSGFSCPQYKSLACLGKRFCAVIQWPHIRVLTESQFCILIVADSLFVVNYVIFKNLDSTPVFFLLEGVWYLILACWRAS